MDFNYFLIVVFVVNDEMVFGVINVIFLKGLSVLYDIFVVGFDDIKFLFIFKLVFIIIL